jgi:pimeloyl-ACP methyl ester carboxylesterase
MIGFRIIVLCCLICLFFAGCIIRRALYPAPGTLVPLVPPQPMARIELSGLNKKPVSGWFMDASKGDSSTPVLLFLHGNGENLQTLWLSGTLSRLGELGCRVLTIDYPGYGRSRGRPSQAALVAAGNVAIDWLHSRYPAAKLVVCGWSLGASVAILATAGRQADVDGLVVLSGWSSVIAVASRFYPRWIVRLLQRDTYNSLAAMKGIRCPALVIHGAHDELIPVDQGRSLADAAPNLYKWQAVDAGHNDLLGKPEVWQAIRRFITNIIPLRLGEGG